LSSWRYGPETDRLVAEAQEREHWSASKWNAWREERLAYVLHRAATRVPYYREQWSQRRRRGDSASWERLDNWPVLEKRVVRGHPEAFRSEDSDLRDLGIERTSGTSGTPLKIWWSRSTTRAWFALLEARWRRWNGVSRRERWAILGGQLVTPVHQQSPPFWVWNAPMRQLYLSSFHVSSRNVADYIGALSRYDITYLVGYSSSLHVLAREILGSGKAAPRMRVAITNAETLQDTQHAAISKAFGCPVRETYGMAEAVAAASECGYGRMHVWPEVGILEFLNRNSGEFNRSGELICTGLLNADMPLIRYAVGDTGSLPHAERPCPCGRTLPEIAKIHGRSDDMLLTRDGRKIFWLNPIFYGLPVEEAQIIQDRVDRIRLRYTPSPGFSEQSLREIVSRLHDRLGAVQIQTERLEQIPREANGKFRAFVCNVPANESDD